MKTVRTSQFAIGVGSVALAMAKSWPGDGCTAYMAISRARIWACVQGAIMIPSEPSLRHD